MRRFSRQARIKLMLMVSFLSLAYNLYQRFYCGSKKSLLLLGSKTSYNLVKNLHTQEIHVEGCAPVKMWMFIRHGTRYPRNDEEKKNSNDNSNNSADSFIILNELEALQKDLPILANRFFLNYQQGRGRLTEANLFKTLKNWVLDVDPALADNLTPSGMTEMNELAKRLKARFPHLLSWPFSENTYVFRFTDSKRTGQSCQAFVEGIWQNRAKINYSKPIEKDPILRFYKNCKKWDDMVENNKTSRLEWKNFIQGPEVSQVIDSVSKRLGEYKPLTYRDVHLMYTACRYEMAISFNEVSPWCNVFTKSELLVLEYIDDLLYYYDDGYGLNINAEQACYPLVDIFSYFNSTVNGTSLNPLGVFYFSHSRSLTKLLARLGLFKDNVPLKSSNYALQAERKWRTTYIQSFGANLAFVLFRCESSKNYKVQLYFNERLVKIPGCSKNDCPLAEFIKIFQPIVESCDLDVICENH